MKSYILIHEAVPDELVPTVAAHAVLKMYLNRKDDEESVSDLSDWLQGPFRKVVCRASEKEIKTAKEKDPRFESITEINLGFESAVCFVPRDEHPKCFKFLRLWKPIDVDCELLRQLFEKSAHSRVRHYPHTTQFHRHAADGSRIEDSGENVVLVIPSAIYTLFHAVAMSRRFQGAG